MDFCYFIYFVIKNKNRRALFFTSVNDNSVVSEHSRRFGGRTSFPLQKEDVRRHPAVGSIISRIVAVRAVINVGTVYVFIVVAFAPAAAPLPLFAAEPASIVVVARVGVAAVAVPLAVAVALLLLLAAV